MPDGVSLTRIVFRTIIKQVSQSPASNVGPAGHLNEQQITNLHEILTKQLSAYVERILIKY